ncbi:hypothetical protein [Bdellovibrio sp. HCB209]|uniref:hypothetical protein n=1 Tax=Bdellovibrio sp. HCB209 TaxID=3394354 RepID=UPI0039B581E1
MSGTSGYGYLPDISDALLLSQLSPAVLGLQPNFIGGLLRKNLSTMLRVENHTIHYAGNQLLLMHTVENVIELNDGIIVLLNIFSAKSPQRKLYDNVLFLNKDLSTRWQIDGRKPRFYTAIFKTPTEVRAMDWEGFSNVLDLQTGRVIREDFPS